jgi:hypothetical protein
MSLSASQGVPWLLCASINKFFFSRPVGIGVVAVIDWLGFYCEKAALNLGRTRQKPAVENAEAQGAAETRRPGKATTPWGVPLVFGNEWTETVCLDAECRMRLCKRGGQDNA